MIFLSVGALLLSASPASADVTTGTCDPGQDPDQCECSTDLDDLGSCAVVSVENLVYPDDLTTLRSQIGATTTYDQDTELYHVAWNVSLLNNLAPVLPLHPNEGVWNSVADLNQYVADLLGVPLLSNGELPNFELEQSGTLVRYDINNDQFLPSTGNLLLDAIADVNGDVRILSGECSSTGTPSDTDSDTKTDDALVGNQVSKIGAAAACLPWPDGQGVAGYLFESMISTKAKIVSWGGALFTAERIYEGSNSLASHFRVARVTADQIQMTVRGFVDSQEIPRSPWVLTDYSVNSVEIGSPPFNPAKPAPGSYGGSCVTSTVKREINRVDLDTKIGPTNCPEQ